MGIAPFHGVTDETLPRLALQLLPSRNANSRPEFTKPIHTKVAKQLPQRYMVHEAERPALQEGAVAGRASELSRLLQPLQTDGLPLVRGTSKDPVQCNQDM